RWLRNGVPIESRLILRIVAGLFALVVAALTVWGGRAIAGHLDESDAGPIARFLARAAWCLALQAGWALLAEFPGERAEPNAPAAGVGIVTILLALVGALAPPAVYTWTRARAEAARAQEMLAGGRLARAEPVLTALCDVGSDQHRVTRVEVRQ